MHNFNFNFIPLKQLKFFKMKKLMTILAIGMVFMASAKNQKVEKVEHVKPLCILVFIQTECGLNEYVNWCPEYGDSFQCLINEADSIHYWNCRP